MERLLFESLLVESAIRAALIAAATALVLALLRVKAAPVRHAVWTGMLVAMLMLPVWVAWGPKAPVRVLPAPAATAAPAAIVEDPLALQAIQPAGPSTVRSPAVPGTDLWTGAILGVYAIGVLWLLLRLTIGVRRANRLTSADCVAPITVGLLRPRVILPPEWPHWPSERLAAILAHEQAHARRHDPLIQWLALFNRAVFWFHPLAWWLERRLAALAEEACDVAVLEQGHDARDYAESLIETERIVMRAGSRFAPGIIPVGMPMPGSALPHRVKLLFNGTTPGRISRRRTLLAAAACLTGGIVFGAGSLEHAPQLLRLERLPGLMLPKPPELLAQVQTPAPAAQKTGPAAQETAPAQPPAPERSDAAQADPEFEAVSIRPADIDALRKGAPFLRRVDDAAFVNSDINLMTLLTIAYETSDEFVSGPSWLKDGYEINAKLPAGAKRDQIPGMLRRMLADRFKLQLHRVLKTEDVYLLKVGKSGIKFKEAAGDTPENLRGRCLARPGHYQCHYINLTTWTANQTRGIRSMMQTRQPINSDGMIDLPVFDETGLAGVYDFDLEWIPADGVGVGQADQKLPANYPGLAIEPPRLSTKAISISQAIDAIGLHLERSKRDAHAIVIDHIEKVPTEN